MKKKGDLTCPTCKKRVPARAYDAHMYGHTMAVESTLPDMEPDPSPATAPPPPVPESAPRKSAMPRIGSFADLKIETKEDDDEGEADLGAETRRVESEPLEIPERSEAYSLDSLSRMLQRISKSAARYMETGPEGELDPDEAETLAMLSVDWLNERIAKRMGGDTGRTQLLIAVGTLVAMKGMVYWDAWKRKRDAEYDEESDESDLRGANQHGRGLYFPPEEDY